jgi:hypothetical protein
MIQSGACRGIESRDGATGQHDVPSAKQIGDARDVEARRYKLGVGDGCYGPGDIGETTVVDEGRYLAFIYACTCALNCSG